METRIHGGLSQDLGKSLGSTKGMLMLQAIVWQSYYIQAFWLICNSNVLLEAPQQKFQSNILRGEVLSETQSQNLWGP